MSSAPIDLGETLEARRSGKAEAEAVLHRELHALLRRMPGARLAQGGASTLEPTGLLHEAVARLLGGSTDWTSREHCFALVAMQMRAVRVDGARRRMAAKRGAGVAHVTLGGADAAAIGDDGLLELLEALLRLAGRDARGAGAGADLSRRPARAPDRAGAAGLRRHGRARPRVRAPVARARAQPVSGPAPSRVRDAFDRAAAAPPGHPAFADA